MVPRIAALLCATVLTARAGIDFTPTTQLVRFEGGNYPQTGFHNGSELVLYAPPAGWSMEGQGSRLQLRSKVSLAAAVFEARPLLPGSTLDDQTLAKLQQEMAATIPREAEEVTWAPMEMNPLLLNRHETRRLTVSYAAFGQRFCATLIVCNFAQEQIIFRFSARAEDFPKQFDLFRRSLYSWQGLP